jgi:hypothetical protein
MKHYIQNALIYNLQRIKVKESGELLWVEELWLEFSLSPIYFR